MRILYVGLPLGALALRARDHCLCAAVCPGRHRAGLRRLRYALPALGAPLLVDADLADTDVLRLLSSAKPDAVVSWFWPRRIPEVALDLAPVRFGVHPSLLPRHRGADPVFWTILAGDEKTGVTAHVLDAGLDTGAVLAQEEVDVPLGATGGSLRLLLRTKALAMLCDVADAHRRGEPPRAIPQDEANASLAPSPTDDDLEIRWDRPADAILRLVRAASPDPGAFSSVGGSTITILAAEESRHRTDPGDAVRLPNGIHVGTATTAIRILRACIAGGEPTPDPEIPGISEL